MCARDSRQNREEALEQERDANVRREMGLQVTLGPDVSNCRLSSLAMPRPARRFVEAIELEIVRIIALSSRHRLVSNWFFHPANGGQ